MFQVQNDVNDPFHKILEAEGLKSKEEDDDDDKSSSTSSSSAEGASASASASAADKMDGESEEAKAKRTNLKRTRDDPRRRRSHHGNDNQGNNHSIAVKDRLAPREWDTTMTCDENDDDDKVIDVIQNRLKEPKRHLVAGVVSVMGKAFALKVLAKTETIEEAGGMPTADNHRRRTPGGVFMQLIKTEDSLTKEQRKKIFENDKRLYNHKQKEMRKLKFAQRNQWRERNEKEAAKIAAEWRGDMEEGEVGEEAEGRKTKTSTTKLGEPKVDAVPAIDDEFGGDDGGCFDDVDAVDNELISGFGGAAPAEMPRENRRTPSPIEDLF